MLPLLYIQGEEMEELIDYLWGKGIKPSIQRLEILKALRSDNNHPTIEMIYRKVKRIIPTISKTTVYNTLNMFVEKKIANIVVIEENVVRYDLHLEEHGHFKCERCGAIHDVEINKEWLGSESLRNFKINESHLYYRGICNDCI